MVRLILIAQCMMVCIAMYGQDFVHPGMLHNAGDLEYLRSRVLAGEEPWKTAWDSLKASELAQLDYQPTPYAVVANGPYNNRYTRFGYEPQQTIEGRYSRNQISERCRDHQTHLQWLERKRQKGF